MGKSKEIYNAKPDLPQALVDSWLMTNQIHDELNELKISGGSNIVIKLSIFLTKSQWLESSISTLIACLSAKLSFDCKELSIARLDLEKASLGQKTRTLKDYKFNNTNAEEMYKQLICSLESFIKTRNEYTHHLFAGNKNKIKVLEELSEGINHCEKIQKEITVINKILFPDLYSLVLK